MSNVLVLPAPQGNTLTVPSNPAARLRNLLSGQPGGCGPCSGRDQYNQLIANQPGDCQSLTGQDYIPPSLVTNYQSQQGSDNRTTYTIPGNRITGNWTQYQRTPGNSEVLRQWSDQYFNQPQQTDTGQNEGWQGNDQRCRRVINRTPGQTSTQTLIVTQQDKNPCDKQGTQYDHVPMTQTLPGYSNQFTQYTPLNTPQQGFQPAPQPILQSGKKRSSTTPEDSNCYGQQPYGTPSNVQPGAFQFIGGQNALQVPPAFSTPSPVGTYYVPTFIAPPSIPIPPSIPAGGLYE